MLAIARAKPALPGAGAIEYRCAPADRLPLADAEFDVAACQQGLQFFQSPTAALAELFRVVRAGGRIAIAVWAEIEQSPAFAALEAAVREVAGDELADRYRAGPRGMPDAGQLRELLEHAGFDEVRVARHALPLSFECASQLGSTLAASPISADLDALPAQRRDQLGQVLERRVVVADALHAEAVAHLAFARR
jgi:ubiquinone/menaquinone biosynthesis C-methylase UbiE